MIYVQSRTLFLSNLGRISCKVGQTLCQKVCLCKTKKKNIARKTSHDQGSLELFHEKWHWSRLLHLFQPKEAIREPRKAEGGTQSKRRLKAMLKWSGSHLLHLMGKLGNNKRENRKWRRNESYRYSTHT